MNFSFNQLVNSTEIYKNLKNYKARALIYQSLLLSVDVERKLYLAFLLKELFAEDNLFNVYEDELSNILKSINVDTIPERYIELVNLNLDPKLADVKKIKFQNDILHRSKVIKHFIDNYEKKTRTEKDFKSVYKKIKKNKKYFISIMDIVVLESLAQDGIKIPKDLDYNSLLSELTIPQNLSELVKNRIDILRKCSDGFDIAKEDLEIRGPGEILGKKQKGDINFGSNPNKITTNNINVNEMLKLEEKSLSRYPEFEDYKNNSSFIFPFIF